MSQKTPQKIDRFVSFVNENKTLKRLKVDIYLDIQTSGWFGTNPFYERFLPLFTSMRNHYINENQMTGAGDVLALSTQEMKDFCQHFVNEYEEAKKILNSVIA
jgi:hypothetical protein